MALGTLEKKSILSKELEIPETLYIRDIEDRVFQMIVLQTLSKIKGVTLAEGGFLDSLLKKTSLDTLKGIEAEQDGERNSVDIKVEVNIEFGMQIPTKADEIQTRITQEVTRLTGIHVSSVHVIFKGITLNDKEKQSDSPLYMEDDLKDYTKEF